MAAGLSANSEALRAARAAAAQAGEGLEGPADLTMLFVSGAHVAEMEKIAGLVRAELRPRCLVGVSAESVIGGPVEVERHAGVSVLAARLPGVVITPFDADALLPYADDSPEGLAQFGRAFGAADDLRAVFLFADPFTIPLGTIIPTMCRARVDGRVGVIMGGFASAGTEPGRNVLVLNDNLATGGAVGVSLRGRLRVDAVVSQGCRPVGPNLVVTACRKNVMLKLGGRPALDVLRETVESLPEKDRPLLEKGVFVGRVVNEYKDRFGRGDYLIRNIMGIDEAAGAVAAAEFFRVGQTIRFHVRDAATADEDLAMLLDAQQLKDPPAGGLLITCNGRGTRLFDHPNHDAGSIVRAFRRGRSGEDLAKAGRPVGPEPSALPLAGLFAAGEIGPVGDESFVHGHTACLALFREPELTP